MTRTLYIPNSTNLSLSIPIPSDYIGKEIEVLVRLKADIPAEEHLPPTPNIPVRQGPRIINPGPAITPPKRKLTHEEIDALCGSISEEAGDRLHAHIKQCRQEWEDRANRLEEQWRQA